MPNKSTLFKAIDKSDIATVEMCLNAGVGINKRDNWDRTPLLRALYAFSGNEIQKKIIQLLLDHHSDVNARDSLRYFPLRVACEAGDESLVQLLLHTGADPNLRDCVKQVMNETGDENDDDGDDSDGEFQTALHFLARTSSPIPNQLEIASLLLKAGADVNAQNVDHKTALDIARETKNTHLIKLLKSAGGVGGQELQLKKFKKIKREALKAISKIKALQRGKRKYWTCIFSYLEFLKAYVNYHPYGWQPVYVGIPNIEATPRTGNLVFANFYTSHNYPWPKHENVPLAPLLQIDLRTIKSRFERSGQFGSFPDVDGLLQVWTRNDETFSDGDGIVRVIPREDLSLDQMTDERPDLNPDEYLGVAALGYGSNKGWGAEIKRWRRITPMFATMPYINEDFLECSSSSEFESTAFEVEKGDDIVGQITEPFACPGGTHLFGATDDLNYELRYNATERSFSGWQNLFRFGGDGDPNYRHSEGATGIIFWSENQFKFVWSR